MDKKTIKAIRNRIWKVIWNEFKNEITMKDLTNILGVPLATFFRVVKKM